MKFIIGYKSHMTQRHQPNGQVVPVTVVKATPCVVTQLKSVERDGYVAFQVGSGTAKRLSQPVRGQLRGVEHRPQHRREFRPRRTDAAPTLRLGETLAVEQFSVGERVDVVGLSKGRGFQGVVKRHRFAGSPKTHGHKDQLRMPGSIGATAPQRVFKGKRMAGHMGHARRTVKHLEVVAVDVGSGELTLKGAVPGARRSLLLIQSS